MRHSITHQSKQLRCDSVGRTAGGQWLHPPVGRVIAAFLLAQGLAHGLQLLFSAGMQATIQAQPSVWSTLFGLVLLQAIQGFSLLASRALAGAGQRSAIVLGWAVGLAHGVTFLVTQHLRGEYPNEVELYGQPLLHVAFGTWSWCPLPFGGPSQQSRCPSLKTTR